MAVVTYRCTDGSCGGTITLDPTGGPSGRPKQDTLYKQGFGPLTSEYRQHDCPVRMGLWPPEIDEHPLAVRVS